MGKDLGVLVADAYTLITAENNHKNKKHNNRNLVLLNYMPIMRVTREYEQIDEDLFEAYKDTFSYTDYDSENFRTGSKKSLPRIGKELGYAYLDWTHGDELYVVFKKGYRSPNNPLFAKWNGKYWRNPNYVSLSDVLQDAYKDSMLYNNIKEFRESNLWEDGGGRISIHHLQAYNYITKPFADILRAIDNVNTVSSVPKDVQRLVQTHLMMAQSELGRYYYCNKSSSSVFGDLSYQYNPEYVPIYYSLGIPSMFNKKIDGISFAQTLLSSFSVNPEEFPIPIKSEFLNPIGVDSKLTKDVFGSRLITDIDDPCYYLTRYDTFVLGNRSVTSTGTKNTRDTYCYSAVFPFLFADLLKRTVGIGETLPIIHPKDWRMICINHEKYSSIVLSANDLSYSDVNIPANHSYQVYISIWMQYYLSGEKVYRDLAYTNPNYMGNIIPVVSLDLIDPRDNQSIDILKGFKFYYTKLMKELYGMENL